MKTQYTWTDEDHSYVAVKKSKETFAVWDIYRLKVGSINNRLCYMTSHSIHDCVASADYFRAVIELDFGDIL